MVNWDEYRPRYYRLVGTLVVPIDDMMEWARAYEYDSPVRRDEIEGSVISTIFLGLDHSLSFHKDHEPIVFETMIFPTALWDHYQTRCSSYEEALAMHQRACNLVRQTQRQLPVVQQEERDDG